MRDIKVQDICNNKTIFFICPQLLKYFQYLLDIFLKTCVKNIQGSSADPVLTLHTYQVSEAIFLVMLGTS